MNCRKTSPGNSLVIVSLVSLLGFAPQVFAATQEQNHQAHHPEQAQTGVEDESPSGTMPMQAHMQKMHRTMEKIQAAHDPKERQKLLDDQMAQMHEMVNMMHGMQQGQPGAGTMAKPPAGGKRCAHIGGGAGTAGGMMGGQGMHGGMMGGGMANHIENRMNMMQQMMAQMHRHQKESKQPQEPAGK